MGAEAGMNPFVAPDMSSFANALAKLPMQVCPSNLATISQCIKMLHTAYPCSSASVNLGL